MTKYIVQGGSPLFGEVHISGAKNAAVAILPAALLVDGVCRIENIPQISDVTVLLKILEQLGAKVRVLNRSDVELDCRHIVTTPAKICGVLGITVPDQTMIDILQRLEFTVDVQADGSWDVSAPLYRDDVESFPDLAEEGMRE